MYFVDDPNKLSDALQVMVSELAVCPLVGVDLEFDNIAKDQKGKKEFYMIISLIQISTNQSDYIFDTFPLRDQIRADTSPGSLKSIFRDQNVTKIFHGFDADLKFLLSDLEIVTINIFDTGKTFQFF